jgi:hypothetical protein
MKYLFYFLLITVIFITVLKIIIKNKRGKEENEKNMKIWIAQRKAEREKNNKTPSPQSNDETSSNERDNALFIEYLREYKREEKKPQKISQYRVKKPMTHTESILYFRLEKALKDHIIFAQVQMSSFLAPTAKKWTKEHQVQLNKVLQKSVDFLIMNKTGKNITAIELQDKSHLKADRQKNDEFKRETLADAGIKFLEFHAENMPSIEEIQSHFNVNVTPEKAPLPLTPDSHHQPPPET